MVAGTICLIESLDPLEDAVLKMSTCFTGPFTLLDLAASECSAWADATYYDLLRLYKALRKLVAEEIIEEVCAPPGSDAIWGVEPDDDPIYGKRRFFHMTNLLIRTVGGDMVLETQRKSVKRQALVNRALSRALPRRMKELKARRKVVHIPWYYEQACKRMP